MLKRLGDLLGSCEGEGIHMKHRLFQAATTITAQSERAQCTAILTASALSTASDKALQNFKRIGTKHFSSTGVNLLECTQ